MVRRHMRYSLVASCLPNCHLVLLRCYSWSTVELWYPGVPFTLVLRLSNSHLHAWLSRKVFIAQPSWSRLDCLALSANTWLLDSLCQDLYTGDRLRKLRYIHSWNLYSGPLGLLHMLISTAGRRLLCFMHCCCSIVVLLTLRWSASHYFAAITVLYYVQCTTLQVALYNGTLMYSEPPLIPEHFH
jgi:hypothetical protein